MRVKLDEDLSFSLKPLFGEFGHEARGVVEQGWTGKPDHELFDLVRARGEFLVTADVEFGDVRRYPPGSHPGILLIRLSNESISAMHSVLRRVLQSHPLQSHLGCLLVADDAATRVRFPELQ